MADRGQSLLGNPSIAFPLGVLGALVILGPVALALNPRIPYHRWQPFHMAVAGGFVLLTAHFVVGGREWMSLASPGGVLVLVFATVGLASITVRAGGRSPVGYAYRIASITPRERGLEMSMEPVARPLTPHRPGQFVFLTARPGGRKETHPFSATSRSGGTETRADTAAPTTVICSVSRIGAQVRGRNAKDGCNICATLSAPLCQFLTIEARSSPMPPIAGRHVARVKVARAATASRVFPRFAGRGGGNERLSGAVHARAPTRSPVSRGLP